MSTRESRREDLGAAVGEEALKKVLRKFLKNEMIDLCVELLGARTGLQNTQETGADAAHRFAREVETLRAEKTTLEIQVQEAEQKVRDAEERVTQIQGRLSAFAATSRSDQLALVILQERLRMISQMSSRGAITGEAFDGDED